jgi:hypothetical protein
MAGVKPKYLFGEENVEGKRAAFLKNSAECPSFKVGFQCDTKEGPYVHWLTHNESIQILKAMKKFLRIIYDYIRAKFEGVVTWRN